MATGYGNPANPIAQDPWKYVVKVHFGGNIVIASIPEFCYLRPIAPPGLPSFPTNWPRDKVAVGAVIPEYDFSLDTKATINGGTTPSTELRNLQSTKGLMDGNTYGITGKGIPPFTTLLFSAAVDGGTLSNAVSVDLADSPVNIFHWLFQPLQAAGGPPLTEGQPYQLDVYETTLQSGSSYTTIENNPVFIYLAFQTDHVAGDAAAINAEIAAFAANPSPDPDISHYWWVENPTDPVDTPGAPQFYNGIHLVDYDHNTGATPPTVKEGDGKTAAFWVIHGIADWTVDYVVNMGQATQVEVVQASDDFAPGYAPSHGVTLMAYDSGSTLEIDDSLSNAGHIISVDILGNPIPPIWTATASILLSWPHRDTVIATFDEDGLILP